MIEPARVNNPTPAGGAGEVAGYELRVISELIDETPSFTISADSALGESVRREAADLQAALLGITLASRKWRCSPWPTR